MLKYIYLAIVAFLLALIIANMFKKKDEKFRNVVFFQIDCALVMVTLILRLLLLK